MKNVVILASGSGSNAQALIQYANHHKAYNVSAVICDRPEALVLEKAKKLNIETHLIEKTKVESKTQYDQRLAVKVKSYHPDWVVLAGYMKLLTPDFLNQFPNRVVNIHPSLLPLFPGKDAYQQTWDANLPEYGCTIHFVDQGMDTGKVIYQARLNREIDDAFPAFKARGLALENKIYPEILAKLIKEYS